MTKELLYQDKKIIYYTYGKGKPVVLIHGFGEYSTVWHTQVEYLKDKFFLIVPDLPGSGQSELINDMSMSGMARRLFSVAGFVSIGMASIGGISPASAQDAVRIRGTVERIEGPVYVVKNRDGADLKLTLTDNPYQWEATLAAAGT